MPRVSILIPTFSRPEELGNCIDSVLASSFQDLEILVGDDGNLGRAVCSNRSDPRLRYIANPSRLGIANNWNALLDAAKGEFMALCMDDDRLHPQFVAGCLEAFDADPTLGVVFTNHALARQGQRSIRPRLVRPGRHDDFSRELLRSRPVAVSAMLMRRVAWDAVRPLPNTAAADIVLFGRLAEKGFAFFYIDEPLMTYGVHDGQLSSTDDFRSDSVMAWSSLRFSSATVELERRRLLVQSLVSRARLHLLRGRRSDARADLDRAARVGGALRLHMTLPTVIVALLPDRALRSLASMKGWGRTRSAESASEP